MTLEDFEKDLAAQKERKSHHRHRDRDKKDDRKHRDRHRDHASTHEDGSRHRHKRRRRSEDRDRSTERDGRNLQPTDNHEAEGNAGFPQEPAASKSPSQNPTRDAWMEAPSAIDIDYVQRRRRTPSPPKSHSLEAKYELKLHKNELNHHLRDLHNNSPEGDGLEEPVKHEVSYTIGDAGSGWRMTRLKSVYRKAKDSDQAVEVVALEQYRDLREFDDAREEEIELDRRQTYGADYVGKEKPNGDLFQERKLAAGITRSTVAPEDEPSGSPVEHGSAVAPEPSNAFSTSFTQTEINKLKAQLLKAQLRKDPKAAQLEAEYHRASATLTKPTQDILLSAMDNRMLSTGPRNEAQAVQSRRGQARGNVEANDSMTIADMVREERRTKDQTGGESRRFAERIAKDTKFTNDLDYLDENASKLAARVHKSELNLRNTAIADVQKLNRALDACPLCHQEDTDTPPVAPVIALGTRTFLTLPTQPEVCPGSATIVPIAHRTNLLECDDDEWEELRNFMKALTRFYHAQDAGVLFYENAADPARRRHAAMEVVILSRSVVGTAPGFFREAILASEGEWSQHRKIIDTLKKAREAGLGKRAFRSSLVKEMPYFHVWFELDGGMGHIVEDPGAWPRGDRFAREVLGGMVDADPTVVRKQGRWIRGVDERVEGFKKKWRPYDWTRILIEGG